MTDCAHPGYREGAEAVSLTFMRLPAHTGRRGSTEADTDDSLPAHPGRRGGTEGDSHEILKFLKFKMADGRHVGNIFEMP